MRNILIIKLKYIDSFNIKKKEERKRELAKLTK